MKESKTDQLVAGYMDFSEVLKARIEASEYPEGTHLPSERSLADEFKINRRTVRRGLQVLQEQGLVTADSTRGHVVQTALRAQQGALGICFDNSLGDADQLVHATASSALIARGFHRRVQEEGRHQNVVWCDTRDSRLVAQTKSSEARLISGLAMWPTLPPTASLVSLLRRLGSSIPVVLLDRRIPGFESDFVGFEDYEAGLAVGHHFADLGYREVGFIGWSVPETVTNRLDGFLAGLADKGSRVDDDFVVLTRDDGVATHTFHRFLAEKRPRAVFCANDLIAMGLVLFLKEHGVRVPEDVAVVGVGDSMGGMTDLVGLTTIRLPHDRVGWEAADILLSRLKGGRSNGPQPIERRLATRLIVRRSCGAGTSSSLAPTE